MTKCKARYNRNITETEMSFSTNFITSYHGSWHLDNFRYSHLWYLRQNDDSFVSVIQKHYSDVIMSMIASQITGVSIVYSTVCSDADQRKHQGSASLAFVRGIHRWPVNSPHKWPVTRKMFPFEDVIMNKWFELKFVLMETCWFCRW